MSTASTYHASDGAAYQQFLGRWTKLLASRSQLPQPASYASTDGFESTVEMHAEWGHSSCAG
jgi:hypothetical protein